jgi:predicted GH43/DUF377 family glycosyl hydrolase
MFRWEKLGKVFSPGQQETPPWMHQYAEAPFPLVLDETVRFYFACRTPLDANGKCVSQMGFVEVDRKDLLKVKSISSQPTMRLGERGAFDEFATRFPCVRQDGNDLICYYSGLSRCESVRFNVAIGAATSRDGGLTFERMGHGPLFSYSLTDPFLVSEPRVYKADEKWYMTYGGGLRWEKTYNEFQPICRIRMAYSTDGLDWIPAKQDIVHETVYPDEIQGCPSILFSGGRYHLFFSYCSARSLRGSVHRYRIGYAVSTDLVHWVRDDAKAGLNVSDTGWDSEMVCFPYVFELDGSIYIAYNGNSYGKEGFGLAKLLGNSL